MKYKLNGYKLRVSKELAQENREYLKNTRIILLQHLFEDTLEFIEHLLNNGATIHMVLGKQYAADNKVLLSLRKRKIKVHKINYKQIESDDNYLLTILIDALLAAKKEKKVVVIHEVGGYFHDVINNIPNSLKPYFSGVVEDTTFGFNRYKKIENKLAFPVFHVARSQLKEIEAVFVGEAIVLAFNNLMRSIAVSIQGREALIVGYGMIGKNIAKVLKNNNIHTTVYDIDEVRLLHAFADGHKIILNKNNLSTFDVIFSATGFHAITLEDIKKMRDEVILISGGSQDTEFDIQELKKHSLKKTYLTSEIAIYELNAKKITVIREGTAINLREKSVPSEIMDIVYSEILSCILELAKKRNNYKPGLYEMPMNSLQTIAKKWLYALHSSNENQSLSTEIKTILDHTYFENSKVKNDFNKFMNSDISTVEQNSQEHLGILFLPIDRKTKKVFLIQHKIADLWLPPGGYVHNNQTLLESIENEIKKNLGVKTNKTEGPFLCSIVSIDNPLRQCRKHYDFWYLLPCNNMNFKINKKEFYKGKWVTIQEAKKLATDSHTISALKIVNQQYFHD